MLEILYRDDDLVAIHKPAGLMVHRSELDRHETRFVVQLLRDQLGRHVYPAHRLDRGTSGVLLLAFAPSVAATLGEAFATRAVAKRYLAVVRGWPQAQGQIDHPLRRLQDGKKHPDARSLSDLSDRREPSGRARTVFADFAARRGATQQESGEQWTALPTGAADQPQVRQAASLLQAAQTDYHRLACAELPIASQHFASTRIALLALSPASGRQHQLRRHLKHIAHPILGDATYGKGPLNRAFAELTGCQRLLLACTQLSLSHPCEARPLVLQAPLQDDFATLCQRLGWDWSAANQIMPPSLASAG